jgi:hypothetical protein
VLSRQTIPRKGRESFNEMASAQLTLSAIVEVQATDYALELWQFTPWRKIWCVARYPLFRTEDGPTDFGSTDMFDSVPASLSVTQKVGLGG